MTEIQEQVKAQLATIITETSLSEDFYEMVLLRLESLGYTLELTDAWSIAFAIQKSENHYKNFCHISEIPEGLLHNLCERVCGEFLKAKYATGTLSMDSIEKAIKSVSMGDTSITFNGDTELDFATLLESMISGEDGDLICYRRIKW
jgi:hypothetical protein